MWILLLFLGFIQLYGYDINGITKKYKAANHLFFCGFFCIIGATIGLIAENYLAIPFGPVVYIALAAMALFLGLLLYTLFFALPFDDTYCSEKNQICDRGMYALCRHPGVIWFFLMYLSLAFVLQTKQAILFGIVAHILNVLYVILQDCIIFPAQFPGYEAYKKTTPFLLPNRRSLGKCMATIRR